MLIRPMTIHDSQIWIDWMDKADYHHQPEWKGCYCRYYETNGSTDEWKLKLGEENRNEAIQAIKEGYMHGYMAFEDDQLIGWANAGHWENYPRLSAYATPYANMDTAMIVCFYVDPRYRQKGVMNALLTYALDDLKGLGYVQVLVMPQAKDMSVTTYSGSIQWYKSHGFKALDTKMGRAILKFDLS